MTLAEWLKKNRWTKVAFAKELKISHHTVYSWTKRGQTPNKHMQYLIEQFTDGEITYDNHND